MLELFLSFRGERPVTLDDLDCFLWGRVREELMPCSVFADRNLSDIAGEARADAQVPAPGARDQMMAVFRLHEFCFSFPFSSV